MTITIENLNFTINQNIILDNICLKIESNETIVIVGKTGAGKSTLAEHICALTLPTSGYISIDGTQINKNTINKIREKVGMVFQIPEHQMFEDSVYNDITFGLKNLNITKEQIDIKVENVCQLLEIDIDMLEKSPFELSDGDKRKVAIAGVIIMEPEIIIFDEPTAGLDYYSKKLLINLISKLKKQYKKTIIIISHNLEDIILLADRIIIMDNGKIILNTSIDDIFKVDEDVLKINIMFSDITLLMRKLKLVFPQINDKIFTIDEAKTELIKLIRSKTL